MRMKSGEGFALVTALIFVSVLVGMVTALFLSVRGKLFLSQTYHDQTAALYLAELAVADAMTELSANPTWTTGFSNKTLPGVDGHYTVSFNTGGAPFDSMQSVNNSDGAHSETYRGLLTLNPGQVLLVAQATVGRSTRTAEAVIDLGGGFLPLDSPLVVDGRIVMSGRVKVDGVQSLGYPSPVAANLHTNLTDTGATLVDIDDTDVIISGTVALSSSDTSAADLGTYVPVGGAPQFGQPQVTLPPVDIVGQVASKSGASPVPGATPPSIAPGGTGSPISAFLDVTQLNHADGPEFYHSGDLTVGDLSLNGASLYVDGNLTVNGAIEGTGAVWTAGNTSFRGSSKVTTATPDRVALYSHGNVELTGFDGDALLQSYAASGVRSTEIATSWATIQSSAANLRANLASLVTPEQLGPDNGLDALAPGRNEIGSGWTGVLSPTFGAAGDLTYIDPGIPYGGFHRNPPEGHQTLFARAASPGRDFLIRRFFHLYQLNYGGSDATSVEVDAYTQARAGRLTWGGVDAINDRFFVAGIDLIRAFYETLDFNHGGSSYFQGQIYTNGYFHSLNDVTVVGAVVTDVDPAARAGVDMTDGVPDPGDVVLENGSQILFVEDFFQARPGRSVGGSPGARIRVWCSR